MISLESYEFFYDSPAANEDALRSANNCEGFFLLKGEKQLVQLSAFF